MILLLQIVSKSDIGRYQRKRCAEYTKTWITSNFKVREKHKSVKTVGV